MFAAKNIFLTPVVTAAGPAVVTFDAVGAGGVSLSDATPATMSWSHTATGSDRVVIVAISSTSTAGGVYTTHTRSVTYGGTNMVSLGAQHANNYTGTFCVWMEFWGLIGPATGAQTINVSYASTGTYDLVGQSISYTSAEGFTWVYSAAGTEVGTALSQTVGSQPNAKIVQAFQVAGGNFDITAYSQTERWNSSAPAGAAIAVGDANGSSSATTFTATRTTDVDYGEMALSIVPVGSPPYIVAQGNAAITASRSPAVTFASYVPKTDDVVLFFPSSTGITVTPTAPSGWVNPLGGTTDVETTAHEICCAYHLVTSGEETAVTTTYTATNLYGATTTGNVVACVVRGVNPASVVDDVNSTFSSTTTATPHVLASLTGANLSTDSIVISCVAKDGTGAYATEPAGWMFVATSNTNQGKALLVNNALTTAGSNVAATNITPSAGDEYASITIALSS